MNNDRREEDPIVRSLIPHGDVMRQWVWLDPSAKDWHPHAWAC